jgi:hypothetical protein
MYLCIGVASIPTNTNITFRGILETVKGVRIFLLDKLSYDLSLFLLSLLFRELF